MAFSALLQARTPVKLHHYGHLLRFLQFPLMRNASTCKFSSRSSSGPQRYIPKNKRLSNDPPFKKKNDDNVLSTQFDYPKFGEFVKSSTKSSQKLDDEEEEDEESQKISRKWPNMYKHIDENQERLRLISPEIDTVEESIQKACAKRQPTSRRPEHVEEIAEVLFFPNEETVHLEEEEPKRISKSYLRTSRKHAEVESRKPLLQSDIQSFIDRAKKAKMVTSNIKPAPIGEVHYTDDVGDDDIGIEDNDDGDDDPSFLHDEEMINEVNEAKPFSSRQILAKSTVAQDHAKNLAIRYLANRPYTSSELKKKLESRDVTPELANYAIKSVQDYGLQSDVVYAETFARARWNSGAWGPKRIGMALKQRGVSDDIIQTALDSVFCEDEADDTHSDSSRSMEMSRTAMERLQMLARKQWSRGKDATLDTKIRRMVSWLQYRGFSQSVITMVLNSMPR